MKKILLLLLGFTIAVGASAGVDSWNQQHDAIKQKHHQALDQRLTQRNLQHKSTTPTKRRGEGPEIITEQPAGQVVTYQRSGFTIDYWGPVSQRGHAIVVYDPDGTTVYVKGLVNQVYESAWVSGTIANGKISIPLGQYVWTYYGEEGDYYYGLYLAWGSFVKNQSTGRLVFTADPNVTHVTYTIDGDNIVMDNSYGGDDGDGDGAIGLVAMWDDEDNYMSMEWGTVFTPHEIDIPSEVITKQPEGELVVYGRDTYRMTSYDSPAAVIGEPVNVVYDADGQTVYIQDIVGGYFFGTWVRGTIDGGKIHVPLNQFVYFDLVDGSAQLKWCTSERVATDDYLFEFTPDPTATEVTYTIDGDNLVLDNSTSGDNGDGATGLALFYDDSDYQMYVMEYNTILSPFVEPTVIEDMPEGELVTYTRSGDYYCSGDYYQQSGQVNIVYAPDGETVYIQDIICDSDIGSWVMGTIENGKIHVPMKQFLFWQGPKKQNNRDFEGWGYMLLFGQTQYDDDYGLKFNYDPSITEATFTISGDIISLDNTSFGPNNDMDGATVLAVVYSDEINYLIQGDLNTVFHKEASVIYEQPEGELVTYLRAGDGIWNSEEVVKKDGGNNRYINDMINLNSQFSTAYVVYAPDGQTVYLQDPVFCNFQRNRGSWVRGTLNADGTKITVPLGQLVDWDKYYNYGSMLAWGSISVEETDDPDVEQGLIFTPDNNVTEVTYTISNGYISLDNSEGPTAEEFYTLIDQYYYYQEIDWDTYQAALSEMLQGTGLAYVDTNGDWTNEINWGTKYVSKHPATLPEPVIIAWHEAPSQWYDTYLEVQKPEFDTDGLPIFEEALSYSIYIDNDQLYTFDASNYNIDEDVTEVTYDMWFNYDWDLYIGHPTFSGTWSDTDGFVPFFNWRIGIQFHYTVDGVKNSTGITYIEVYEKPDDVKPGDANGDNEITIADVSTLIDMLLDDAEYFEGADVNGDGFVTIADVSALIDMLLEN